MRGTGNVADMIDENFCEGVRKPAGGAQDEKNAPAEVVAAVRDIATEDEVRRYNFGLVITAVNYHVEPPFALPFSVESRRAWFML